LSNTTYSPADVQVASGNWLTPKDLQHELRIGAKLAYKLLKSGTIPSVRVGGLIRIYRPQLEEALLEDLDLGKEKGRVSSRPDQQPLPT
jgi:excisionase family DNA binding protein